MNDSTPRTSEQQLNLLDFDSIPVIESAEKLRKSKAEYYLRDLCGDKWYFLHCTHANGGPEWEDEKDLTINGGRMKPLRYKTYEGAKRQLALYVGWSRILEKRSEVAVWHE